MLTAVRVALAEDEGCATIRHPPLEKKQYEYSIHKSANESKADEPGAKPSVSIVPSEAAESARLLERVRGLEAALVQERRADTGIANESEDGAVHIVGTKSASQKETARSSMTVAELQQLLADAEEARAQANFAMEASNARLAEVEGKLTLYFDGADLDQLQEKHRVQDEKIAEYELLLQQTSAEVVELQSELRAKQYVDECLQEYEVENERLVDQLSTANNTLQQLRISFALELNDASADGREGGTDGDAVAREREARIAELEQLCTDQGAKISMLAAELRKSQSQVNAAIEVTDEREKDARTAELEQAIESFRLEEIALHDEIEVTKALLEGKELMLSDNAHRFQFELDTLREEIQHVSEERDRLALRCPDTPEKPNKKSVTDSSEQPVQLLLEINRADREIALVPKSEMRSHLDTTITVIDALSGDLAELNSAYKAVVKAGSDVATEKSKLKPRNPLIKFHQKFLSAVEKAAASAVKPKQKADATKLAPPDSKQPPRPEHAPTRYAQLVKVKEVYEHHAAAIQDRLQRSTARAQESIRKMIGFTEV